MKNVSSSETKRVLLAVRHLWGDEGINTQMSKLAVALEERGWSVGFLSNLKEKEIKNESNFEWIEKNTDIFYAPFSVEKKDFNKISRFFTAYKEVMKSIQEFEPKIIHFHSISISPYFLLYRLYNDIETVFTCHVEIEDTRQYIETVRTINKISGSFLGDKAIAISEDMKKIITDKLNFPKEKTTIISNGVNSAHFRPPTPEEKRSARQFFGLQQDDKVVCLVGRLDPVKGHDTLFSALSLLKENGLRVRAICAGSGGFDDEIKGQAVDHGVADDVIFPGFTDSRAVYWASDVNVLPSYREGFALVVPEAMLCKIPTVRTPAAGAQEQIQNGENGFIIPFDDPHALADHIRYLFENPGKRVEMGRKAQATAGEHFTLEKSIEQKISLYRSLLEG